MLPHEVASNSYNRTSYGSVRARYPVESSAILYYTILYYTILYIYIYIYIYIYTERDYHVTVVYMGACLDMSNCRMNGNMEIFVTRRAISIRGTFAEFPRRC